MILEHLNKLAPFHTNLSSNRNLQLDVLYL